MEWIKCSDKLPNNTREVLACDAFRVFIAIYDEKHPVRKWWHRDDYSDSEPTHWVEIPKFPEE